VDLRDFIGVIRRRRIVIAVALLVTGLVAVAGYRLTSRDAYEATATLQVKSRAELLGIAVRNDDLTYLDRLHNTYARLAKSPHAVGGIVKSLGLTGRPEVSIASVPNTELMQIKAQANKPADAVRVANALADRLVLEVQRLSAQSVRTMDRFFEDRLKNREGVLAAQTTRLRQLIGSSTPAQSRSPQQQAEVARLQENVRASEAALAQLRTSFEQDRLSREAQAGTVSVVERAALPAQKVSRNLVQSVGIVVLVGLVAGVGLAFVVENWRSEPRTPEELEDLTLAPVLGVIPSSPAHATSSVFNSGSAAEDAIRRLCANFLTQAEEAGARSVSVVSAEQGDGKSTVVANLAVACAEAGKSVLLIDGDVRAPTQHGRFEVSNGKGLADLVDRPLDLQGIVQPTAVPGLFVLPAGLRYVKPANALTAERAALIIGEAVGRFDLVFVDTAALLRVSDALGLVAATDGALIVARSKTRSEVIEQIVDQLKKVRTPAIGIVANAWSGRRHGGKYFAGLQYGFGNIVGAPSEPGSR
jgi:capsular exopolysaccharide synthesis family protein